MNKEEGLPVDPQSFMYTNREQASSWVLGSRPVLTTCACLSLVDRGWVLKHPSPPLLPSMAGPWSSADPPPSQASGRDSSARKMPAIREGSKTDSLQPLPVDLYSGPSESLTPDNLVLIDLLETSKVTVGTPRWKQESRCFFFF